VSTKESNAPVSELPLALQNPAYKQIQPGNLLDEFEFDDFDRPILSGEEKLLDTEHFRIHYTFSGRDAAFSNDFIQGVAIALEYSWDKQINEFGWQPPPGDNGLGGDDRLDVYIQSVSSVDKFGYADKSGRHICDPSSVSWQGVPSYFVIDNNFANHKQGGYSTQFGAMQTTVAHELNHAIQFGYIYDPPRWLAEATATWMEDEVYDDINGSNVSNPSIFKSADTCQSAMGGIERVEDYFHWYAEWLYIRYISENYGHDVIREIWENAAKLGTYAAMDAALSEYGPSVAETFTGFSLALLARSFEEGSTYPTVRLEGQVNINDSFSPQDGVGQMAADYVEIMAKGNTNISLHANDLQGLLVGLRNQELIVYEMPANQIRIDASDFKKLYLVIVNLDLAPQEFQCEKTNYTIETRAIKQLSEVKILQTIPVPDFHYPKVELLRNSNFYYGTDWIKDLGQSTVPLDLLPGYLPPEYGLYDIQQVTADEWEKKFGIDSIWYIPGGGEADIFTFYGPCDENYLEFTISESPHRTLQGWFIATDHYPEKDDHPTIAGVETEIYRFPREDGQPRRLGLTFIYDGYFIVINGTLPFLEMEKIVASIVE